MTIPDNELSGELSIEANQILNGGDRTYPAYQRLSQLADQAKADGDEDQLREIGALIEAFIVDGGETEHLEPLEPIEGREI